MSPYFNKIQVEIATVDYFRELGYQYGHGPEIARDGDAPELGGWKRAIPLGSATYKPLSSASEAPAACTIVRGDC